jgi:ubiquinone/menaquinone biosynthesis C-methylase UbiE
MERTAREIYTALYDQTVPDWPGELAFYLELAALARHEGRDVLEIACGTGRVTIPLAREGARVTGLELCPEMLRMTRERSGAIPLIRWVQADMRSFDLGQQYGLVIIPGHSFQFMLTPEDQVQ